MAVSKIYKGTEKDFDELVDCLTGLGIEPCLVKETPLLELPNNARFIGTYKIGSVEMIAKMTSRNPAADSPSRLDDVEVTLAGEGKPFIKIEDIVQYHLGTQ